MIVIVLNMRPAVWINSMIITDLEPREKTYEELIEYLEKHNGSLPDEPIQKKEKLRMLHCL